MYWLENGKKLQVSFYICSTIMLLVSCATSPSQEPNAPPVWLEDPSLTGYIAVVSSAMPQRIGGMEGQRRVALNKARAELAKAIRVQVKDELMITKTDRDGHGSVTAENRTRVQAMEMLRLNKAFIKAEWSDPVSKELFYWYVTPISK